MPGIPKGKTAKLLSWAGTAGAFCFIAFALWLFARTLHRYDFGEAMARLEQLPAHRIGMALLCVAASYLTQTGYDYLAAVSVGVGVSPGRAALAGFVGNALTNNIGFSLFTGTSVRYRYYLGWGFSPLQIAEVVALAKLAFANGLFLFAGLSQIIAPVRLPLEMPFAFSPRAMGFLLLLPTAALLLWNGLARGGTLALGKFRLVRPRQTLLILQIAVACVHFAFAAGTLYYLLPAEDLAAGGLAGPLAFIGTFMAIKFAVMFLPVPGNLGVFEAAGLSVLTPALPDYPVLGALLGYRLAYYILPFAVALATMAAYELSARSGLLAAMLRRRRSRATA